MCKNNSVIRFIKTLLIGLYVLGAYIAYRLKLIIIIGIIIIVLIIIIIIIIIIK